MKCDTSPPSFDSLLTECFGVHSVSQVLAIVQVRMSSKRLPGKAMLNVGGKPLIQHVVERTRAASKIDKIVFAVPDSPENKLLVHFLSKILGEKVYLGSELDVLSRFIGVIIEENPEYVVRVTADDPLKDPALIDQAIDLIHSDLNLDYVSNCLEPSFPEGLDIEVFKAQTLIDANQGEVSTLFREHVTPIIWSQPSQYSVKNFTSLRDFSDWRWTLDNFDDWIFLDTVLRSIDARPTAGYDYREVVKLLDDDKSLRQLMPIRERSTSLLLKGS